MFYTCKVSTKKYICYVKLYKCIPIIVSIKRKTDKLTIPIYHYRKRISHSMYFALPIGKYSAVSIRNEFER